MATVGRDKINRDYDIISGSKIWGRTNRFGSVLDDPPGKRRKRRFKYVRNLAPRALEASKKMPPVV